MANVVVALMCLVGVGAAQAETVIFEGPNATEILDLQVGDTVYDVIFLDDTASNIYGTVPIFDFTTSEGAEAAMEAVNDALNTEPDVMSVGPAFDISYEIPFEFLGIDVNAREAFYLEEPDPGLGTPAWLQRTDPQARPFEISKTWAVFTAVPEPAATWLSGSAIVTLGVLARRRKMTAKSATPRCSL
jgi:hypothetical protein